MCPLPPLPTPHPHIAPRPHPTLRRLRTEIDVMAYLAGHPNIVQLHDVYETRESLFLVQEMCAGGNLREMMRAKGKVGEAAAARIFRGVVKSVLHCHQVRNLVQPSESLVRHYHFRSRTVHACTPGRYLDAALPSGAWSTAVAGTFTHAEGNSWPSQALPPASMG